MYYKGSYVSQPDVVSLLVVKESIIEEECYHMAILKTILGNSNPEGYQIIILLVIVVM